MIKLFIDKRCVLQLSEKRTIDVLWKGKRLKHSQVEKTLVFLNKMSDNSTTNEAILHNCFFKKLKYPYVEHFPNGPYQMSHAICFVFNIVQTILIIVLNYPAIYAFYKSSQLRKKTTFFLVMVLSASDLVIGLVVEPLFLVHLGREIFGHENCFIFMLNVIALSLVLPFSILTFLVLNFEIYLSVMHPFFHKSKVTKRRVFCLLLILWSVLIIREYLFVFILSRNTFDLIVTLLMSLEVAAIVLMQSRIFVAVYRRRRISMADLRCGKAFLRGVRDAKSCLFVLLCTACCYLPAAIESGLKEKTRLKMIVLEPWTATFILSASMLNSIVFYWRNKTLREKAKDIVRKLICS